MWKGNSEIYIKGCSFLIYNTRSISTCYLLLQIIIVQALWLTEIAKIKTIFEEKTNKETKQKTNPQQNKQDPKILFSAILWLANTFEKEKYNFDYP